MNKNFLLGFITFISIAFLFVSSVEAKRFGGGMSFGGKKSYSSPYKRSTTQQKSFSQQKAATSNQQRKQQLSKKGGLMGMLGGLALGGLLGTLFFGGAFENFNFFDFFIIGGVIFAFMWFMNRKKQGMQAAHITGNSTGNGFDFNEPPGDASFPSADKKDAGFTQSFASLKQQKNIPEEASFGIETGANPFNDNIDPQDCTSQTNAPQKNTINLPEWFDQEDFLSGARSAYTLLQEAWDSGDLEEIKALTTESVYAAISQQHAEDDSQGSTRILQLNAELIDFSESDEQVDAAVLFDALLGESDAQGNNERAAQVRELWHFVRKTNSSQPTWYLDGIQQLD